jgi:hypothetical protein
MSSISLIISDVLSRESVACIERPYHRNILLTVLIPNGCNPNLDTDNGRNVLKHKDFLKCSGLMKELTGVLLINAAEFNEKAVCRHGRAIAKRTETVDISGAN